MFDSWIHTYIDWFGAPRRRFACIREFVLKGLCPFLRSNGYQLGIRESEFMNYIANVLYDSRTQSCLATVWNYKITNTSSSLEERAHFDFVMSEEVWGRFWSLWGDWEDVSLSQERGWDRRIDIQEMVWKFLNLDMSEQTDELIALLIGGDEEDMTEDTRKQVYDIYLQESEMNGWAGYRR